MFLSEIILVHAITKIAKGAIAAIHPFCKYALKNDRLSEQIHNKFN